MGAGAFIAVDKFVYHAARQAFDFLGGTIKAALYDNAHTPNPTANEFLSDLANEVSSGTYPDYARQTLGTKTITQGAANKVVYDAADVSFGASVTIAARYIYLFLDTGVAGTSKLMGYLDLNNGGSANVSSVASAFSIAWNANGIYSIDPSP